MNINDKSDDYKKGWYDGYQAAEKKTIPIPMIPLNPYKSLGPTAPSPIYTYRCSRCNIDFNINSLYCCTRSDCPSGVTYLTKTNLGGLGPQNE